MAVVQDRNLPELSRKPLSLPTQRLDTRGAFGQQLGEGLQSAAGQIAGAARAYEAEREREDQFAVLDRENKWIADANKALRDPQQGYLTTARGEDALNTTAIQDKLEQLRQTHASELPDGSQRELFMRRTAGQMNSFSADVLDHASRENLGLQKVSYEQARDQMLGQVSAHYDKPELLDQDVQRGLEAANLWFGKTLGLKGDQLQAAMKEFLSDASERALQGYIAAEDATGAANFLKANGDALGSKLAKYQEIVTDKSLKQQAESTVAGWLSQHTNADSGLVDVAAVLNEKIEGPEPMQERVRQKRKEMLSDSDAANRKTEEDHYQQALTQFNDKANRRGLDGIDAQNAYWLQHYAPEKWDTLVSKWERKQQHAATMSEHYAAKPSQGQREEARHILFDMATNGQKYVDMMPGEFDGLVRKLPPTLQDQLTRGFLEVREAATRPGKDYYEENIPSIVHKRIIQAGRPAGLFQADDDKDWSLLESNVYMDLTEKVREYRAGYKAQHNGAEPPVTDYNDVVIGPELRKVKVNGTETTVVQARNDPRFHGGKVEQIEQPGDVAAREQAAEERRQQFKRLNADLGSNDPAVVAERSANAQALEKLGVVAAPETMLWMLGRSRGYSEQQLLAMGLRKPVLQRKGALPAAKPVEPRSGLSAVLGPQ